MSRLSNLDLNMRYITCHPDRSWRVWVTYKDFDSGQCYFSYREHGGQEKALTAAKKHRDAILKEQGIRLRKYDGNGYCVKHCKSTSNQVGVSCNINKRKNGQICVSWIAKIQVDGTTKGRGWSVRRYGYTEAWKRAVALRCAHTREPIPTTPPPVPERVRAWAEEFNINLDRHD